MTVPDDAAERLVQDATRGDAGALEALLARYWPGLQAFVRRRAGGDLLAKESSSDLAQSVCREVLEGLVGGKFRYRGEAEFKQWLFQAALFKIRSRRAYRGARKRDAAREQVAWQPESGPDAGLQGFFRTFCTPSREAVAREELEAVERAFAELSERYQEIIVLARVEGLSHREIGERLEISEKNSSMLLARALSRLATLAKTPDERP